MQTITEIALEKAVRGVFTRQEAAWWVDDAGSRLDALLKRAVAAGEILRIRRGLFCLHSRYGSSRLHPFELAQRIHGPSYISMELALAHHGWIPEAVHAITCATRERSRSFDTPLGLYTFTRIPQKIFLAGVHRVPLENGGSFFLANPLKALSDYVYVYACDWCSMKPVVESLRVDEADLGALTADMFDALADVYMSGRVRRFLEGFRKDLTV